MFEAVLALLGIKDGTKLGRGVVLALLVAALFAAGGLGFWRGMATIERMVETARTEALAARDAHWKAEIEKSNAAVEKSIAENAIAAAKTSAEAEKTISGLRAALAELEAKNVTLPNGNAGGLDRARVQLLRRSGTARAADPQRRNQPAGAGGGEGTVQPPGRSPGSPPDGG